MAKTILKGVAIFIAFVVITAIAVLFSFDPNYYKGRLTKMASTQLGREVNIDGKIGWHLWPYIGVTVPGIRVANAPGFSNEPMLTVDELGASVELLPLLRKEIKVDEVFVRGAQLRYETRAGKSNIDGLMPTSAGEAAPPATDQQPASAPPVSLAINSVKVEGIIVESHDLTTQAVSRFKVAEMALADLTPGGLTSVSLKAGLEQQALALDIVAEAPLQMAEDFSAFELKPLSLTITGVQGDTPVTADLAAQVTASKRDGHWLVEFSEINAKAQDIAVMGNFSVAAAELPTVRFDLRLPRLDLNPYLPPKGEPQAQTAPESAGSEPPDLSVLHKADIAGTLAVDELLVAKAHAEKLEAAIRVGGGVLSLTSLAADLYGGKLAAALELADKGKSLPPSYQFQAKLDGVAIQPLLSELADFELLAGKARIEFQGRGQGLDADAMRRGLAGRGAFELRDGAVKGINIAQQIRDYKAILRGEEASGEVKQTDFTALTGTLSVADGIATNPDLNLMSPLLRVSGAGKADLVGEQLDYRLGVSLVGTSKGQDGKARDELAGVTIPLMIRGPWSEPQIQFDFAAALQSKAGTELRTKADKELQRLEEKLAEDDPRLKDAADKLKAILGGKKE